jgi:hypothetical protein
MPPPDWQDYHKSLCRLPGWERLADRTRLRGIFVPQSDDLKSKSIFKSQTAPSAEGWKSPVTDVRWPDLEQVDFWLAPDDNYNSSMPKDPQHYPANLKI